MTFKTQKQLIKKKSKEKMKDILMIGRNMLKQDKQKEKKEWKKNKRK